LKNRVTGVVDLGAVAPLPAGEAQPAWSEIGRRWHEHSNNCCVARKKRRPAALVEMCTVRLGSSIFGVPITHIWKLSAPAAAAASSLAPVFCGGPGATTAADVLTHR